MKKTGKLLFVGILLVAWTVLCMSPVAEGAPVASSKELNFAINCWGLGSTIYTASLPIFDGVKQVSGIKVTVIPTTGSGATRMLPCRDKKVQFFFATAGTNWFETVPLDVQAVKEIGPQRARVVWLGSPYYMGAGTRASSKIRALSDFKGKRFPYIPGYSSVNMGLKGTLAFAGLSDKDVIWVTVPSYGKACEAVEDGTVDTFWFSNTTTSGYKLEGSPHGFYWPPYPPEDKEGWARLRKYTPYMMPGLAKVGAGLSEKNPVWLEKYTSQINTHDWLPEGDAYALCQAIDKAFPIFKDKHPFLIDYNINWLKEIEYVKSNGVPFHPGSIKYFKEKGFWTNELEDWNNELLMIENERFKAWTVAPEAARKAGIEPYKVGEGTKWPEFWENFLRDWMKGKIKYSSWPF
jgi:hypothetical protein